MRAPALVLTFWCLAALATTPLRAQPMDPASLLRESMVECMRELGFQAPVNPAQQNQVFACARQKSNEKMGTTPQERARWAQQYREKLERDAEASRDRHLAQQQAADAQVNEVRSGAYGRQMQVAVLCRDEMQRRGLTPDMPPWPRAILNCAATLQPPAAPSAASAEPAVASDAWCELETRKKRWREGDPDDQTGRAVADKKGNAGIRVGGPDTAYCAVLSGQRGPHAQAQTLCTNELTELHIAIHLSGQTVFDDLFETCERRRFREIRAATGQPAGEPVFGDATRMHDYLNALYHDDLATVQSLDLFHGTRLQMRGPVTLVREVLRSYLGNYPSLYASCLEPDAPTVMIGEAYDDVTRDGRGMEISRRRVDTRRQFPVNRRFIEIARANGVSPGNRLTDGLVSSLGRLHLGDLAPGRVDAVVRSVMTAHRCDSDVVRRLERKLLQHAPDLMKRY